MAHLAVSKNTTNSVPRLQISLETLLYIGLVLLAITLRLLQLGAVPLGDAEAHEALAALSRIKADLPQNDTDLTLFPTNGLGAIFNTVALVIFGYNAAAARLATALAGVALVLTPLLYRRLVGRVFCLMVAAGFAVSPVAIAASRTMSGMVWAMLLVMIGGWLVWRFYESRQQGYAIAATICAAGVIFLTTPYGILVALAIFAGVARAILRTSPQHPMRNLIPQLAGSWAGWEAIVATVIALVVVATGFFIVPSGISSISALTEQFFDGLSQRPDGGFFGYALLVNLRYDLAFILFGVLAAILFWRDATALEDFCVGWLGAGMLMALLYPGADADFALLLTVPAVMLTASFARRLLTSASFGFWELPAWLLPAHALVVASLLISLGINVRSIGVKLLNEARPTVFAEVLNPASTTGDNIRISTLEAGADSKSTVANLPLERLINCTAEERPDAILSSTGSWCDQDFLTTYTVKVVPLDAAARQAGFVVRDPDGVELVRFDRIEDSLSFTFTTTTQGDYRFNALNDGSVTQDAQYLVILKNGDLLSESGINRWINGGIFLDAPIPYAVSLISFRTPNPAASVVALMILLIIPITFFLSGAFYGARAAWRGLGLGLMLYVVLYGMALGWQATTVYGGDVRELWYADAVPVDYDSMEDILVEYSRRENGTPYEMEILVQHDGNGALGWALRNFRHARFVEQIPVGTTAPAILAPEGRPSTGADYVGQQLILDYEWSPASLNWTDFTAWLFARDSRIEPTVDTPWRVWIRSDIYDVVNVPQ